MCYTIKTVEGYQNLPYPVNSWPNGTFDISNTKNLYVYNIETEQSPGFTVGIIGSKRLGRYFDLRFIPTLSFSDRQLNYTIAIEDLDGNIKILPKPLNKPIFTTFVEFPLNVKYRSKRYNNIGAYLMTGINPKLDLASQKSNTITDPNGNSFINNLVTKRFDFAAEVGVGFDIYNQWFKMGIEIKMSYGLLDIVKNTGANNWLIYTAPIDKISNKLFQVSLLIE